MTAAKSREECVHDVLSTGESAPSYFVCFRRQDIYVLATRHASWRWINKSRLFVAAAAVAVASIRWPVLVTLVWMDVEEEEERTASDQMARWNK